MIIILNSSNMLSWVARPTESFDSIQYEFYEVFTELAMCLFKHTFAIK